MQYLNGKKACQWTKVKWGSVEEVKKATLTYFIVIGQLRTGVIPVNKYPYALKYA